MTGSPSSDPSSAALCSCSLRKPGRLAARFLSDLWRSLTAMENLTLPSGLTIELGGPLTRFCAEEWAYYDGIPDRDPNQVLPDDVLATVAMNSFVNTADKVRSVHRGLAEAVNPVLSEIPPDADLRSFDPDLAVASDLLHKSCAVRGVLVATATKVLHRKRRSFIPMLDTVVLDAYLDVLGRPTLVARVESDRWAELGVFVWRVFRRDLTECWEPLEAESLRLGERGWVMTPLRVLEVAVWMATEPQGYYRSATQMMGDG